MLNAQQLSIDLANYRIEGYANEDPTHTHFSIPLISQVNETLWQGGCENNVDLQGYFPHIISLYPWERYRPDRNLSSFVEVRLFDGPRIPDEVQLHTLAHWVNLCQLTGPTLVHCQRD